MIKRLFVNIKLGTDRDATVELQFKGDGIEVLHVHHNIDDEQLVPLSDTKFEILWENEVGEKANLSGYSQSRERLSKTLLEYGSDHPTHMWKHAYTTYGQKTFFEPGTLKYKVYDLESPFFMNGLGTPGNIISTEQADEKARAIADDYGVSVEEYELNETGHVYTLDDGNNLVIRGDGSYYINHGYGTEKELEEFSDYMEQEGLTDIPDDDSDLEDEDDVEPMDDPLGHHTHFGDDAYDHHVPEEDDLIDPDEEITIVAYCHGNGEVIEITAPREEAIKYMAQRIVDREDFSKAPTIYFYTNIEMMDFLDTETIRDIYAQIDLL